MRRLLAITLAALAALGGVAWAAGLIRPARRAPLRVSVAPGHQSAVRGGTARFSVTVTRSSGLRRAITLNTSDLPRGVSARWQLANGRRSGVVSLSQTGAVLILRTSGRTPYGTRRVRILAAGGGFRRSIGLALTVVRNRLRRFSLRVTPTRQAVAQGRTATYRIRVDRAIRFHRPVALRISALPHGARVRWTPTSVTVRTTANQQPGSYRLVLEGRSRVSGRMVRRNAVVVLSVVRAREFRISGDLSTRLYPGVEAPLDLVLTNPNGFTLRMVALSVRIGPSTSRTSCSGDTNYAVSQYRGRYPLLLRPGSTRLSSLAGGSANWPRISMRDLPTNQDACQGAIVALTYRGTATR
jgi:hypothetical protein